MLPLLFVLAAGTEAPALPAFMAGCWDLIEGEHWTQECWMEPKAGLMLGASREGTAGKLKSWEQLRIEQSSNGKVTLYASPGGRTPLPFEARKVSASEIEFVNAAHDFPQRIAYSFKNGRLAADTSLIDGSKPVRWTYVREENSSPR